MKNKVLLKVFIIILIVLLFLVAIIVGRKALLIISLSNKAITTMNNHNNYHVKMNFYQGDDTGTLEIYKKDGKSLSILNSLATNFKHTEFNDGQTTNLYVENNEEKIAKLNITSTLVVFTDLSTIYDDNWKSILSNSFKTSIKSTKCNGRECYYIENFSSPSIIAIDGIGGIFIEKQTGLPIRILGGTVSSAKGTINQIIDYTYEFDSVTDKDMEAPDLSQYQIN